MWIRAIFFLLIGYFLVAIYPMASNSGIRGPSIDDIRLIKGLGYLSQK
jgi:hypothetical protein